MVIVQSNGAATSSQNGNDFSPETEADDVDPVISTSSSDSSDLDSGMESDEADVISFLEPVTELCQVGNQTLALPIELCELDDLGEILSIETWNEILSDSDRFELAKYLPDMDQENFARTIYELLRGENLNFGNPLRCFFNQLKSGEFDPRVVLYRKGINLAQKRGYFCNLREYQDSMVGKIVSIKEALRDCDENYGIEERIRFVNIVRNQEAFESESDQETELEFESESGYKSDSELENSDSDYSVSLRKGFVNGGFDRRNQKLGFEKVGKLGRKKAQLKYESAEEREREEQEVFVGSFGSKAKIKGKNRKNLDLVKVKGLKEKSLNAQCWTSEDGIEMNNSPDRSEETESDLSQKDRAVQKIIIESEIPKKKTKKYNKKEKKVKKQKKLKGVPRGRKGGRKRKSEDNINVVINNENTNTNINNNIPKIETKVDENLVEIPVLLETEQENAKLLKGRTKKTLISKSESPVKKRKRNEQIDKEKSEIDESNKKKGRKKSEPVPVPIEQVKQEVIVPVPVPEPEPQKKQYVPIKPTIHTDFSFSIVHLLSSVRIAMINSPTNNNNNNNDNNNNNSNNENENNENENNNGDNTALVPVIKTENQTDNSQSHAKSGTSLTVQQIAERVRSDPLDPSILTSQQPLNDLIKGALRILSSKQAPLGIKSWKPLVSYTSSTKTWNWTSPVNQEKQEDQEPTCPDAWGLPHKTLVKLVDSLASWLKQGEETLKKLGGLGPPPVAIHASLTEKDRFKDIKSLKSQYTIPHSCKETKTYFQKEEQIRYSIPDRAFAYTATDGRKSTVAPLGRSSSKKPSKKARDHFMLKPDRPPHVTILGLVRDAASRLPGRIGTRADVCTLIRDSQFVIADVAEDKISEVVSGALDRLHYQEDPCVRFDGERKLWVYLHGEREEEQFEDDGNQSTKKWKKPKKEEEQTGQTGQDDKGLVQTGQMGQGDEGLGEMGEKEDRVLAEMGKVGQEDQVLFETGQMGQEDRVQTGQDCQAVGQMGQGNQFVDQTGHMGHGNQLVGQTGHGNQLVGQTGQLGLENQLVSQTGQMGLGRPLGFQTGQMGLERLLGFQTGQTSQAEQLWGQTGQESGEAAEPFGEQRRLGFFNRTL